MNMVFNSLGSNYNFSFVIKALFASNNKKNKEKLKSILEKKYRGEAVLLYKGREALILSLQLLKLPRDGVVAINGFTCFAVAKAVEEAGCFVELLDIEKDDLNFSAKTLEDKLRENSQIKAVIIQNTLGYPCEIEKIAKICKDKNLILIEDLAHCVGAKYANGKEAGTVGDFACLSFSQDKMIDSISGGALIIRNKKYKNLSDNIAELSEQRQIIDRLYSLFTFIIRKTYNIGIGKIFHFILKTIGILSKPNVNSFYKKYSLPAWYCSLAVLGFEKLDNNISHRREIARIYKENISPRLFYKTIAKNVELGVNLRFPIFVNNRKSLIQYLRSYGIYVSDIWYSSVSSDMKNCTLLSSKILNLPTHINTSKKDAKKIANLINKWQN